MHARTLDGALLPGFRPDLVLHFFLFTCGHAVEALGQIAVHRGIYLVQHFLYRLTAVIGSALIVLHLFRILQPAVYRNGKHIHRNFANAKTGAGDITVYHPLCPGADCHPFLRFQGTVINNRTDRIVDSNGIDPHADADKGGSAACTDLILNENGIFRIRSYGPRRQFAAGNPAGHPGIQAVYRYAGAYTGAEQVDRHACRDKGCSQAGSIIRLYGQR